MFIYTWNTIFLILLSVFTHIFFSTWVSRYQNVSILDYFGVKDDGDDGDGCRRAKLQSNRHHQQTNAGFFQTMCTSCCPTSSVRSPKEKSIAFHGFAHPKFTWVFQHCLGPLKAPGYLGGCLQSLSSAL